MTLAIGFALRLTRRAMVAALMMVWAFAAPDACAADLGAVQTEDRKSGFLFLTEETRQLQLDPFLNPGMFTLERGRQLWGRADGSEGHSCATCHGDGSQTLRGVAARYPVFDPRAAGLVNLEMRINAERRSRMGAAGLSYDSDDLIALTTYLTSLSQGFALAVDIDGPARTYFEQGRAFFTQRRGQLDLACTQCHDARVGSLLRGDRISQGQINGFPIYRLTWSRIVSRHRMFQWCNTSVRAEPYALGATEYLSLELYLAWRGRGLAIEAPAVRR